VIADAARLVGSGSDDLMIGVQRKVDDIKALQDENKNLRSRLAVTAASALATQAVDGIVVAQVDDLTPGDLRDLTIAVRQQPNIHTVVLIGVSPGGGVSLVGAVDAASGKNAAQLITSAAKAVGGGGGGKGDIATAGGKNPEGIPEALRLAQEAARS
jgi:alanyl-tRNA synthetase